MDKNRNLQNRIGI
jgi:hypothetical protein